MANHKKYFTEEERKAANKERQRIFREKHPDKHKKWAENNKEHLKVYRNKYENTIRGKSIILYNRYRADDRIHGREEGNLSAEWILENILSKPCAHCGETDWTKIGCNRLDNSKPHTMDNVEPCCWECNNKLGRMYTKELNKKPAK